jgi:predicted peroxiredoxin
MSDDQPVLVLISVDPRESHRANEAMRIGLGVVSGENEVVIVLTGPAVHLLDADTDELMDGDEVAKFRDSLRAVGVPFHVEAGAAPADPGWNTEGHTIVPVSADEIAELVRGSRRVLVF